MITKRQTENQTKNQHIIVAILNGETVQHTQYYDDEVWVDFDIDNVKNGDPFGPWNCENGYQWRVKPKVTTYKFSQVIQHQVEIENAFVGKFINGKTYYTIHSASTKVDKINPYEVNSFNYGIDRLFFEKEEDAIKALNVINQKKGN